MACLWWKKSFIKQERLLPSRKVALTSNYLTKGKILQTNCLAHASNFLRFVSISINIMRDTGCIAYWHELNLNKINKCTATIRSSNRTKRTPRLKLSDLIGAFVLWINGMSFSVGVFIIEKIAVQWCQDRRTLMVEKNWNLSQNSIQIVKSHEAYS